jgi:hypothetical protein
LGVNYFGRSITCGGKVKVIACIEAARPENRSPPADLEEPKVIEKIREHLGLNQAAMPNNRSPPAGHHDLFDQVTTLI